MMRGEGVVTTSELNQPGYFLAKRQINAYYAQMDANMNLNDMAAMLVAAVVLLVLVNKIPPMIGHIAQGGGTHALGGGFGAGSAIAAAGVAGAAAAMAGSTAVAGAANIAGGAQAVMAAAKQASQIASSASDLVSRMGGIVSGALDSNTSNSSSPASTSSPLACANNHIRSDRKTVLCLSQNEPATASRCRV